MPGTGRRRFWPMLVGCVVTLFWLLFACAAVVGRGLSQRRPHGSLLWARVVAVAKTCRLALSNGPFLNAIRPVLQYKTGRFASGCGTAHCTWRPIRRHSTAKHSGIEHRAAVARGQPQYAVTGRAPWPENKSRCGTLPHLLLFSGPCWLLPQAVRPRWLSAFRFCRGPGVCRRECLPRLRCPPTGVSGRARCRPPSAVRRTAGGGCGLPGGARRCAHRPRGSRC